MPYNTNPITPSEEVTGTVSLPRQYYYMHSYGLLLTLALVARVKKIIGADEDISACSNNAAFAIAVATEMFIQHLAEQTYNVVKSEKKPRRNVQYRDVGMLRSDEIITNAKLICGNSKCSSTSRQS